MPGGAIRALETKPGRRGESDHTRDRQRARRGGAPSCRRSLDFPRLPDWSLMT